MQTKLPLLAVLIGCLFSVNAQSPITLTYTDMPVAGNTISMATDTPLTSVSYGNAGANQVYDFSTLSNTRTESAVYAAPTGAQTSTYPNCNLTVQSVGSTAYLMIDTSTTKYTVVGAQGTVFGVFTSSHFSPTEDIYHWPMTYQSTFSSSWGFYQAFTGAEVGEGFPVDSVREIYTDNYSVTVDGWGKVITPVGSYRGLRVKRIDNTNTEIDAYYFGSWNNVSTTPETTTEYSYVAKETHGAVVSFTYDSAGDMKDAQYSLLPPAPPVAGFSYVTGSAGLVTFTDTSEGYPTRYHWNFGDGDTSNVADPTHTYAANGTYYVCETVYNAGGSNTVCDSVHVTDIIVHERPVAHNDTVDVHQPNSDTIAITAIDYSPSNDPFCVTAVYGGTYFSVLNCNDVAFNPTAGFTGWDSCHYIICNTNQPTLCDTGVIVVDVIPTTTHLRPVAVNDTSLDIENHKDTVNVTANDYSPSGDPFCITTVYGSTDFTVYGCNDLIFTPGNNFTGYDTAWYIICNTGQSTLCDTARVIVDVVKQHLPPVAVNEVDTVLQPGSANINVTGADYSPSSDPFCITAVYGSPDFSVLNCNDLTFTADSTFTGNDTVWYIICNTGQPTLCDTASIVVTVTPNSALWPVTNFSLHQVVCQGLVGINESLNSSSIVWAFTSLSSGINYPDTTINQQDTVQYGAGGGGVDFQVCLTASNQFGSTSKCDTMVTVCEDVPVPVPAGIYIYPNPTSSLLTIDMVNCTSQITKDYTLIEIYDAVGKRVEVLSRTSQPEVVNVPVAQLAAGIYLATIVDGNGRREVLGKFAVTQ